MSLFAIYPSSGSRTHNKACAVSPLRPVPAFPGIAPVNGNPEQYYYEQDYQQFFGSWQPLHLNAQHPDRRDLYLVEEGPGQDLGGGLRRWTRIYAPIFLDFYTYQQFSFTYPGTSERPTQTVATPSKLLHHFMLLGVSLKDLYGTGKVQAATDIPLAGPRKICDSFGNFVDTYANSSAVSITDALGQFLYTTWNEAGYMAQITAGNWMVAEDSVVTQWRGNLYERVTRYVRCQ